MKNIDIDSVKELIKRRRFQVLVHSYIYFRLDDQIISNQTFDQWARELIDLQKEYPAESKEVELYEIYKDFTSVGCSALLPLDGDARLASRAAKLLQQHKLML